MEVEAKDRRLNSSLINNRWLVQHKLAKGNFGDIYEGYELDTGKKVAIKMENTCDDTSLLHFEYVVYKAVEGCKGINDIYYYGKVNGTKRYCLVMKCLGRNLEQIRCQMGGRIPIRKVNELGIQILDSLKCLHRFNFIHSDVKPTNVLEDLHTNVYLIDFSLCCVGTCEDALRGGMRGTPKFASINAHLGKAPTYSDDLESLCYTLIYLYLGRLPWQEFCHDLCEERKEKLCKILRCKINIDLECLSKAVPTHLIEMYKYARSLHPGEKPDIEYCQNLLECKPRCIPDEVVNC